ncbi:MAG: MinD/ParA family protein [Desulfobacter sp.]|nr:MAG: MinD/ParA family protein [Desulfobacter sp.]
MAKVLTIASGKGGVGKTSISLNLSLALAKAGYRVCLFDGDLGLANVNILTGLYPDHGLADVIEGRKTLKDFMIKDFNGIDMIPGSSGVDKLADLTPDESGRLINAFLELSAYDYFILDTSAGISSQVLSFCRACHEMILVATPEPTSLTDAYSLLKVLARGGRLPRIRVVINQVQSAAAAKKAYAKLKKTVHKFLSLKITPLGIVARDPNVPIAVVSQIPFFMLFPDTMAARCIRAIALKLVKDPGEDMPVEAFWDQCLDMLSQGRPAPQVPDQPVPATNLVLENQAVQDREALEKRLSGIENKMDRLLEEMAQIKVLAREARPIHETPPEPKIEVPKVPWPSEPLTLDFEDWLNRG